MFLDKKNVQMICKAYHPHLEIVSDSTLFVK